MAFYKKHFDIYSIVLMIVEPLTSQVAVPMGENKQWPQLARLNICSVLVETSYKAEIWPQLAKTQLARSVCIMSVSLKVVGWGLVDK